MKRSLVLAVAAAFVAILAIPAISNAGGGGWTPMIASKRFVWQQPLPQGNPINTVDFLTDTLGWAVGDNGTVLKTTNGGFSWTNQGPIVEQGASDRKTGVFDVDFVDANNGWIAADTMVYRTTNGGTTWSSSGAWMTDLSGKYLAYTSADFADINNGWMVGSHHLFHTTNGGATVESQTVPGDAAPTTVKAISSAQAVAWGYPSVGYLRTDDGGANWIERQFAGTAHETDTPWSMAVCSASTMYAVSGGDLLKTTNGGSTWTTTTVGALDPGDVAWMIVSADGDATGQTLYLLTDGSDLLVSTNGGDSWTKKQDHFALVMLDVPSASGLFGVKYSSGVVGSTDSGGSWYDCGRPGGMYGYSSIDFSSETTGHAIAADRYARTSDGGTTWNVRDLATLGINLPQISDMTFLESDPQRGWIVGSPAGGSGLPSVYRTIDAGATWSSLEETRMVGLRRVRFSDANSGWAIYSYQDGFWHSSDGGNSWSIVPHAGMHWDIDFVDANNGWISYTAMSGMDLLVARTADGGSTWTTQTVGHTGGVLLNVDFADANTGYVVDSMSNIFKTTNGGETWTEISFSPYAPTFGISDIKFSTPLDGWVVGSQNTSALSPSKRHDFAAHTTDGGATWDFYADGEAADYGSTGTNVGIQCVDAVGSRMWFGGGNSSIVASRPKPVATITSASHTLARFGQSAIVAGTLALDGAPLGSKRVDLWSSASADGPFVKTTLGATTGADGSFSVAATPSDTTYYKARFGGDETSTVSTLSGAVRITPAPGVGNPIAPSKMKRSKSYTIYGYLKPRHVAGTYPVRIYLYRYVSGKWKSAGYVKAKAANYSSYTKYSAKIRLTKSGKWRLRAYHPVDAGQIAAWSSGYDYVRVP